MYENHPQWIACREGLARAYVDLYQAIRMNDPLRVEEERMNIEGYRSSAAFAFAELVADLDFTALCDAFTRISTEPMSQPAQSPAPYAPS